MKIEHNKDITNLTTFGIPVKTAVYAEYESTAELLKLTKTQEYVDNKDNILCLGGGSNLLFVGDFNGMVLHSVIKGIHEYVKDSNTVFVYAGAGEKWTDLVEWCLSHSIAGLENLAGIPGDVGASAVQNVGAYGAEAGDFIHTVECFDIYNRKTIVLKNQECQFGYRNSIFKHHAKGRYIVTRVSFRLRRGVDARNLEYKPLKEMAENLGRIPSIFEVAREVVRLRDSKLPDPSKIGSAGSFFKNPEVNTYFFEQEIIPRGLDIPHYPASEEGKVKLSAAWLIDHAGLKGFRVGDAEVWPGQPLVIANTGHATATDVTLLARHIVNRVRASFGIELQPEVNYIDNSIKVRILGSGTSKGVPEIGCTCYTCTSSDTKDKRLRASVLVETRGLRILIDASPDLRQQALKCGLSDIDAVLLTHQHYDHVGGIDDLRPFCTNHDVPVYANSLTVKDLHNRIDYCFRQHPYPGVPRLDLKTIGDVPFYIDGLKITPVEVLHGKLPITGYRIGNFAYVTDIKTISESQKEKLKGLDVLILSCLRINHPHFAHLILPEALSIIDELKPKRCYLTHACHNLGRHEDVALILPDGVEYAYDGELITV